MATAVVILSDIHTWGLLSHPQNSQIDRESLLRLLKSQPSQLDLPLRKINVSETVSFPREIHPPNLPKHLLVSGIGNMKGQIEASLSNSNIILSGG